MDDVINEEVLAIVRQQLHTYGYDQEISDDDLLECLNKMSLGKEAKVRVASFTLYLLHGGEFRTDGPHTSISYVLYVHT
jgi:hypothetical protein